MHRHRRRFGRLEVGHEPELLRHRHQLSRRAGAHFAYDPLWQMVLVRWVNPAAAHELKSEEELLAAEENKELVLEVTNIVVNCPVTRGADGQALHGVR